MKRTPRKLTEDGKTLCVIRPANPSLALQVASIALKTQDSDLFNDIPQHQDYTYRGYLSVKRNSRRPRW